MKDYERQWKKLLFDFFYHFFFSTKNIAAVSIPRYKDSEIKEGSNLSHVTNEPELRNAISKR